MIANGHCSDFIHSLIIFSDEGLTLETSPFETLYVDKLTLTQNHHGKKKETFQLHNIFFFFSAYCVKYTFFVFKVKDWISKFAY